MWDNISSYDCANGDEYEMERDYQEAKRQHKEDTADDRDDE